jgi:hypothetical protein
MSRWLQKTFNPFFTEKKYLRAASPGGWHGTGERTVRTASAIHQGVMQPSGLSAVVLRLFSGIPLRSA